jgi:WhiB family redox-sensing transcriptional regulator
VRDWADDAACLGMPTEMFFVEGTQDDRSSIQRYRLAKAVCAHCPVMIECARYALARPEVYGVWGGMSPRERLHRGQRRAFA